MWSSFRKRKKFERRHLGDLEQNEQAATTENATEQPEENRVYPGAVAVPGINASATEDEDTEFESLPTGDESSPAGHAATALQTSETLVSAEVVDENRMLYQAREQVISSAVVAEVLPESVKPKRLFVLAALLLIVTAIAVGLGVGLSKNDRTVLTPSPAVSLPPSPSPTFSRLEALGEILLPVSGPLLFNDTTSQYQALDWLANVDGAMLPVESSQELFERYILALLYFSTNGVRWGNELRFLQSVSVCNWQTPSDSGGVNCTESGFISKIHLEHNELQGTIPFELGQLSNLEELYLSFNSLTSTIPSELGNLHLIRSLSLQRNVLTGTIPTELGNLPLADHFDLAENCLTGTIPPELGNLSKLTMLFLYQNRLSGKVPRELGFLSSTLRQFHVQFNTLFGDVPTELGKLTTLRTLDLYSNSLEGDLTPLFCNRTDLDSFLEVTADCDAPVSLTPLILCECCTCCLGAGETGKRDLNAECCTPDGRCWAEDVPDECV